MPLPNDIATDSAHFDSAIPVTLNQKRAGMVNAVSVSSATTGPLTNRQIDALGGLGLIGGERNFSLDALDVGPGGVQPGDVVDDGTNRWTVLSATLATLGARWRCVARMQP
jgi:hypothetical protein